MAILYNTDGTQQEVEPENGSDFKLKELYDLIECDMIQVIYIGNGDIMIIAEEGKLGEGYYDINEEATKVAREHLFPGDVITGNALVCRKEEFK